MENNTKELLIKFLDKLVYDPDVISCHDIADELLKQFEIKPIDPKQKLKGEIRECISRRYVIVSPLLAEIMACIERYDNAKQ